MYKKLLSSLVVLFALTGCSSDPTDSMSSCQMGAMQTSFMNHVGMEGDRVFFDLDKSAVTAAEAAKLDKQVAWLAQNENASVRIVVEGHCDARGTSEYNLGLGKRRAEAVKAYLVSKAVSADRIDTVSYGKERPAVVGSDEAAYAKNRRGVTVVIE
ncbi:peptidoglycan-associated lipoprotein Pal [Candidatus Bodocaedibacter vickermanii]|uniref:Peptidoglycan-associated lipoprotein n=1 Tax=Candidatus Bodocaedibacter vickermanii TaxID=2741701 RepID=A0A7L9RUB4_9PROT|nr:Peptidoglycan-associated lipoprotein [Candidatus Paracaedibacteraceae bacterium 'Lake Konstanz']